MNDMFVGILVSILWILLFLCVRVILAIRKKNSLPEIKQEYWEEETHGGINIVYPTFIEASYIRNYLITMTADGRHASLKDLYISMNYPPRAMDSLYGWTFQELEDSKVVNGDGYAILELPEPKPF